MFKRFINFIRGLKLEYFREKMKILLSQDTDENICKFLKIYIKQLENTQKKSNVLLVDKIAAKRLLNLKEESGAELRKEAFYIYMTNKVSLDDALVMAQKNVYLGELQW